MAIRALTGLAPEWFEPERYKYDKKTHQLVIDDAFELEEGEEPTGFEIRPLSSVEYVRVLGCGEGLEANIKAFEYGLVGWRNFTDDEFNIKEALELIPPKYIMMIGSRVMEISSLDGEQAKN